jgi:hypothetical protein
MKEISIVVGATIIALAVAHVFGVTETKACESPSPVERLFVYQQGHCDG